MNILTKVNTIDLCLVSLKCWYFKVLVRVVDVETWRYVNIGIYSNLNHNFTQVGQKLTKITKYKKSISTLPEIILKHRKIIKFLDLLKYFLFVLFWAEVAIMSTFVLVNFVTLFWCHLIAFIVLCGYNEFDVSKRLQDSHYPYNGHYQWDSHQS